MKRHSDALLQDDYRVQALEKRVEELEAALQARDEFIATVGHELKNPLTPLLLQAQHLTSKLAKVPEASVDRAMVQGKLRGFTGRLERFLHTLDRILDVSRITHDSIELELEPLDLAEVVRGVADSMRRDFEMAQAPLQLELESVTGHWDRMRLEQVCFNLLSNALRYGLSRPVHVQVRRAVALAELVVTDQGLGIDPVDQATIFERFDRGSAGASRTGGLGVGLWIVRKICAALGGYVGVRGRVGHGSIFTVRLPCHHRETP